MLLPTLLRSSRRAATAGLCAALVLSTCAGAAYAVTKSSKLAPHGAKVASGPASLPMGPAPAGWYPFGSYVAKGYGRVSLPPRSTADVAQERVAHAPKVAVPTLSASAATWPNACKLTSAAQLNVLDPAIVGLQGAPQGWKGNYFNGHKVTLTPGNTGCSYYLSTRFAPSGRHHRVSYLEVQLVQAASAASGASSATVYGQALAWAKTQGAKSPGQFANYPGLKNGTSCFETAMEMTPYLFCLAHQVYFSVTGDKVTGGPNPSTDNAIWVAQAEIPLAEVLGAELKAAPAPPRPTTTTVPGPVTTHPPTTTPTTVAPTTTTTGPNAPTTVDVTTTTVPYKVWSKQIGSGVTIVPPGPASAGDGSPADAAMGFIPAFVGPDPTDACQYFAPAAADACKTFTSHIRPLNLDVKALAPGYTAIKDDRALVVVTETICASSGCQSASQASVGFSTGQSFDKLWDEVVPAFAATDFSLPALPCVQVDGHWYIDPPAAFPQTSTTPTS